MNILLTLLDLDCPKFCIALGMSLNEKLSRATSARIRISYVLEPPLCIQFAAAASREPRDLRSYRIHSQIGRFRLFVSASVGRKSKTNRTVKRVPFVGIFQVKSRSKYCADSRPTGQLPVHFGSFPSRDLEPTVSSQKNDVTGKESQNGAPQI